MSTLNPDFSMANRFINLLTGSEVDPVTFQFFSDKDKRNRSLAIHRTMKRPLTYDYHRKKQDAGCGVYVMVNRGDGKGRAKKNVVEILALFIDLDGAPWEPAAKMLKPHIIVDRRRDGITFTGWYPIVTLNSLSPFNRHLRRSLAATRHAATFPSPYESPDSCT